MIPNGRSRTHLRCPAAFCCLFLPNFCLVCFILFIYKLPRNFSCRSVRVKEKNKEKKMEDDLFENGACGISLQTPPKANQIEYPFPTMGSNIDINYSNIYETPNSKVSTFTLPLTLHILNPYILIIHTKNIHSL